MRVIKRRNPHLIDKENEIWGLEQEEIGTAFGLATLSMLGLIVVLNLLSVPNGALIGIFSLFPSLIGFLYLFKRRKDRSLGRGNLQREIYEFVYRRILRRKKVYV